MASIKFSVSLPVSPAPCGWICKHRSSGGFAVLNYPGSRLSRCRSLASAVTDVAFSPSPLIHVPGSSPKEVHCVSLARQLTTPVEYLILNILLVYLLLIYV